MKRILVLGAGHSSPYLITDLLRHAVEGGWIVAVADRDPDLAVSRLGGHPRGEAVALDARTEGRLAAHLEGADLVVNLLPPGLQSEIARECVRRGRPMISASYATPEIRQLSGQARDAGVMLLMEAGLDPGIDHMASMSLVDRVHAEGGVVEAFESYGSGVPAPDSISNPLAYVVTWHPRSVVLAAEAGAHYLRDGRLRAVPKQRVFTQTWSVEVPGVGVMEAYPNRDSLAYRELFGLAQAHTLIRGTLRYPGWCATWQAMVRLGLASETISIPRLAERSFAEIVEMFLPEDAEGQGARERTARFLGLEPDGRVISNLDWLGLFDEEPLGVGGDTATDALVHLLRSRLRLPEGGRDMVILHHDLVASYPGRGSSSRRPARERITATLVHYGEPGGTTAMARTVGLPAAIAARLTLAGRLDLAGCHIPTEPEIYRPVLEELAREGVRFEEHRRPAD